MYESYVLSCKVCHLFHNSSCMTVMLALHTPPPHTHTRSQQKTLHTINDLAWMQICRYSWVDVEDLLSIPDHAFHITWQRHFALSSRECLPQDLSVLFQLLKLLLQFHVNSGIGHHILHYVFRKVTP